MISIMQPVTASPSVSRRAMPQTWTPMRAHAYSGHRSYRGHLICRTPGGTTADTITISTDAPTAPAPEVPAAAKVSPDEARALVDQVLAAIKDTDSGQSLTAAQRDHVDTLLERLEAVGQQQQPRPLENPLLWGHYNVDYTSPGRAPERGEPAGGRFRSRLGRFLFRTAGLFQSVIQPDIATNKVEFKLFGLLPGYVGLRGRVVPQGEGGDTVAVLFERPVLSLANCLHLRIGRVSSVGLVTTYLDERVRLGRGTRGSLFVFTRGGAAENAGMDTVCLERTSGLASLVLGAFFAALFMGGAALWGSGQPLLRAVAGCMWAL
ncbi:hypothetical protein Agub_g8498, partial [Astrephomene gubernaculifera]